MNELERIKGTDSVADGLMKSDRNFTKLKLEVENIDVSEQLATKADKTQVVQDIATHNTSIDSHADIRTEIASVKSQSNEIVEDIKVNGVLLTTTLEQSIPSDTSTPLTWNTVDNYKDDVFFNALSPTRITIPINIKKVKLSASVVWRYDNNNIGVRQINIYRNGVIFKGATGRADKSLGDSNTLYQQVTTSVLSVTQGDYFEIRVKQTGGIAQPITEASGGTWFAMEVLE